jgi:hypothetical protein
MTAFTAGKPLDREAFDWLVGELRPKLHRYCARMTGSVLDGEDVVHEAIVKAMEALSKQPGLWMRDQSRLGAPSRIAVCATTWIAFRMTAANGSS